MYPISVIIALGSNIGNFKINFQNAIESISKFGQIKSVGQIYVSKPYGLKEQNNFFNTAIEILTTCQPMELMSKLQSIEKKLIKNKKIPNGPRKIDLDIIFFGSKIVKNSQIEIPHPRAMDRDFVLKPICDFKPFYRHPLFKLTLKEALESLGSRYIIKSLDSSDLRKKFF